MRQDWNVEFEWKPQDLWIGAFWKRQGQCIDLWICFVPCIPLHISWWGPPLLPSLDPDNKP